MCIGTPLQVIEMAGDASAWCGDGGAPVLIDMMLVGPQPAGTWVLAFQGAARQLMSPEHAEQTRVALAALSAALAGDCDMDRFFPDLANREPELPEHLRRRS
jgi:hydrogenase expression/formation protein HypC